MLIMYDNWMTEWNTWKSNTRKNQWKMYCRINEWMK